MAKKILAFVSAVNTPGKPDATGAFIPESIKFINDHGPVNGSRRISLPLAALQKELRLGYVSGAIESCVLRGEKYDCVAFFCHGWQSGMQTGHDIYHATELAASLSNLLVEDGTVALYACSTAGDNDGKDDEKDPSFMATSGFAHDLAKALNGHVVFGHTTPGHCTTNPYAQRFCGSEVSGNGQWYIEPGSSLWSKYVSAMRTDFRFEVPFITPQEVRARLQRAGKLF